MTRARLGLLIPMCFAGACQRGGTTTLPTDADTDAQADAPVAVAGPALAITAVPQRVIPIDPSGWAFDPSGRFVAADFFDDLETGCGIWDIESGALVREYRVPEGSPCLEWDAGLDSGSFSDTAADGQLRAFASESELEIEIVGGASRIVSGCTTCAFETLVWAPKGHHVATCDGHQLEIWNADAGTLAHREDLGVDGEVHNLILAWTDEGLVATVVHEVEGDCTEFNISDWNCEGYDYGYDEDGEDIDREPEQIHGYALSSFWWPQSGEPVESTEHFRSTEAPDISVDPGGHWLIYNELEPYERRSGQSTTLHVIGTSGRSSRLGWTDDSDEGDESGHYFTGFWRVDAATQWLESFTIEESDGYSVYGLDLGWRATVAEPNPAFHRDIVFHGNGFAVTGELEIIGAAGGVAVTFWEGCGEYDDEERCESADFEAIAGDCEVLDVSPQLSLALVDCGAGLSLIEARGEGASFSALPFASNADWQWGRGNWLALLEGGKLGVVDLGSGRVVYERSDVIGLASVPLAAQHDLLAIDYGDHLEFVAAGSGETRIDIAGKHGGAALSPDGKRLAVIADGEARVIEIANGATVARFAVGDAFKLAWRQDGAVLFYGYDWPTHSANPKTGELLGKLEHPILDVVEPGDLDPSWRWIHRSDGSFTRTLDFMRIEIGMNWARTDSGLFDGDLTDLPETVAELGFRIGDDPDAVPIHSAEDLEPWLRKAGLIQAFFLGEALPNPTIPADAAAKLEAKREAKR